VRRVSVGATLSVLGLSPIGTNSSTVANSSTISTEYDTTNNSRRIGYGLTGQVAVTDHFAVAIGAYLRRIGYQMTTTISTTTTTVSTGTTTASSSTQESTHARILDFPVLVRYYGIDRHTPGPRWFAEGGAALREVSGRVSTSISATDTSGATTCCNTTPAKPANHNSRGFVGGAGVQLIDPFGIRVVPEVRYTRWVEATFDAFSTRSQRNQVEAGITLSF
jgi:hypothetical protein